MPTSCAICSQIRYFTFQIQFSSKKFIKIMMTISLTFEDFVHEITKKGSISEAISSAQTKYSLKTYKITEIEAAEALKLYQSIYHKFYKAHSHLISTNWYENQLRIFIWTLACYIYLHDVTIESLGERDWHFFATLFDKKDPKLFQYQCHAIYSNAKNKTWENEEEQILKKIMLEKVGMAKWNEVSKQLFELSLKKYFRTAKQCRERWNNHLDPSKLKGFWRPDQCLIMFEYVKQHGKKWANLVRIFNKTRNEHSIKNKFNSIMKKHRKLNPQQEQSQIYDQIIMRIKKSIENMAVLDSQNISYDFEQFEEFQLVQQKKPKYQSSCHEITQNFLKILHNYNSQEVQQKYKLAVKHDQRSNTTMPDQQFFGSTIKFSTIPNGLLEQKIVTNISIGGNEAKNISYIDQQMLQRRIQSAWGANNRCWEDKNQKNIFRFSSYYNPMASYFHSIANPSAYKMSFPYNIE